MQVNETAGPSAPRRRNRRPFFGWWIVLGTVFSHGLHGSTFAFSFGAYLLHVQNEFGWSKFAISTAYSVSQLMTGVVGPAQGWLVDRFGPRAVARVGFVVFGLSFMAMSRSESMWTFYLFVCLAAVGAHAAGFLTLNTALANWFLRKRARAMGLGSTGLGLGGLLSPIVVWSLATYGWRETAFASGIAILLIGLPLAQVFRRRPEDHGLMPDGAPGPGERGHEDQAWETGLAKTPGTSPPTASVDFTVREALRDRSFWLISLGHGTALLVVVGLQVHLVPHLVEGRGWTEPSAQAMLGAVTVISVLGQVGGGILGDRYNKAHLAAFCMLGHCAAMLALAFGPADLFVVAAAVIHGVSWGIRGPLMMAIRADYFGRRNFATIMGYSNLIVMLGPLFGPSLAGAMSDAFGDYTGAFLILGVLTGLGGAFFVFARRPPVPQRLSPRTGSI